MRILVSTFAEGDDEKVLLAMRSLSYDQLVLMTERGAGGKSLDRIGNLELLSGHHVSVVEIEAGGFMTMVDSISSELAGLSMDRKTASRNDLKLNISGGTKLMGDAALLAAFRLGVEAYHCDGGIVRLPVLKGATAMDRFTDQQVRLMDVLLDGEAALADVLQAMSPSNKISTERTIRELKRLNLMTSRADSGRVLLGLSPEGAEVARATRFARGM